MHTVSIALAAAATVAVLPSLARADAPGSVTASTSAPAPDLHMFVAGGGGIVEGGGKAVFAEAAIEVGQGPLWLHGMLAELGPGEMSTLEWFPRAGFELRECKDKSQCAIFAADLGAVDGIAIVTPRFGFDVGGDHLRVRAIGEVDLLDAQVAVPAATVSLAYLR
ncbi:MAG TPA: hypothetical protein VMJ10_30715 [Kofleriaceae bacterium]|nr:hypothetical protein [Kofleriaceae bacterium]